MNEQAFENPLMATDPRETLENCAAALEWMAYAESTERADGVPHEEIMHGKYLLKRCIIQALRSESECVGPR